MKTLANVIGDAQRAVASTGAPHTVLNLNTVGASLYVIRDYPGEDALTKAVDRNGKRFLAAVVWPDARGVELRGGYTL